MRVAVISDIHANLEALRAVLDAIEVEDVDEIWSLGDTIGYGPRPNECCSLARERAALSLVGNHDLLALGSAGVDLAEFNREAAAAALWTRAALSADGRAWLERLAPAAQTAHASLYHASARNPVWEYVLSAEAARASLELAPSPLVLVGHSHVALALALDDAGQVGGGLAPDGARVELDAARWLLNPGSVGQPRDADPRAAFLLLDLERRFALFRRVPYSVEQTQREIRACGLPESLAARLSLGQ